MKTRARSDLIEMGERPRSARSRRRPCLFSEVAARANGPRTVPVRSASAVKSGLEKSAVCAADNPLRTGTVRGPMQRNVPTGLNNYPIGWERERIVLCQSSYPTTLAAARDGSGCSLSRRTGEGQGEGCFDRNTRPVGHLFLHKPLRLKLEFVEFLVNTAAFD